MGLVMVGLEYRQERMSRDGGNLEVGDWYVSKYRHVGQGTDTNNNWPVLRYLNWLVIRITDAPCGGIRLGDVNFIHKGKHGEKEWQQAGFHGSAQLSRIGALGGTWLPNFCEFSWLGHMGMTRRLVCMPLAEVIDHDAFANVSVCFHRDRAWAVTYFTRTKSSDLAWKRQVTMLPLSHNDEIDAVTSHRPSRIACV